MCPSYAVQCVLVPLLFCRLHCCIEIHLVCVFTDTDSLQTVLSLDDKEEVNGPGVPPAHGVMSSASSHDKEKKQSSKVEPTSPQVCIKFSSGWPFIQATLDIHMCILTLYRIN